MNKRIGLLLISEAFPKPLAKWNHDATYKEMYNFIKEHKTQEKVTLKVGDVFAVNSWNADSLSLTICGFSRNKINIVNDLNRDLPLTCEKYYVNGKLYASENIIVPDFKEEEKVESNEITKDNIVEVLKYNNLYAKIEADLLYIYFLEDDYCIGDVDIVINIQMDNLVKIIEATYSGVDLKLKPLPKANPFDVVKVGQWIRSLADCGECRTKFKWYQRCGSIDLFFKYRDNVGDITLSNSPKEWDLTDIRDYNPTECELKIGDIATTENMVKINPHNYLIIIGFDYTNQSVLCKYSITNNKLDTPITTLNETGIYTINSKAYDKITIPPFDFAKCLVDAGFTRDEHCLFVGQSLACALMWLSDIGRSLNGGRDIEPTPANAKIIIEMAKLAKDLK